MRFSTNSASMFLSNVEREERLLSSKIVRHVSAMFAVPHSWYFKRSWHSVSARLPERLSADGRDNDTGPLRGGKSSKSGSKTVDHKSGGDDDDGAGADPLKDSNPNDWLVPRTTMFVLVMFIVSFLFWYASHPWGKPCGWATLKQRISEIESIQIYHSYAQIRLTNPKEKYLYVGIVDSSHTDEHIRELRQLYEAGRKKAQLERLKKTGTDKEEGGSAGPFSHEELPVLLRGSPIGEGALKVMDIFAWMVPFVFFPIYVMILSHSITKSVSSVASIANQSQQKMKMTYKVEKPSSTRFRDIAGMKEPKEEITEIVDFLRFPQRYTRLGAKIPTGALLLGPPGTGKTLLAKAVSGESGVSFIPTCGSDFVELYAGMGAKRIRELFDVAKKQRCIIYIDEIDAIGLKRQGAGHGEKQEQEHTLNELLTQLDGFASEDRAGDVILLASSNVPLDSLDSALVRPGRFDRIIHVDPPVKQERVDIFSVHLCKLKIVPTGSDNPTESRPSVEEEPSKESEEEVSGAETDRSLSISSVLNGKDAVPISSGYPNTCEKAVVVSAPVKNEFVVKGHGNFLNNPLFSTQMAFLNKTDQERQLIITYAERMSDLCPGFVGADIAIVCNEAAILAAQEDAPCVSIRHLERSIDRVLAGIEHRSRVLSDFEKRVVAHHEAGHALVGWFLERANPLMKVSIVPRGGSALGYAQYLPSENRNQTAQELRDAIAVTLGGRIAEEIFFQHLSTGASDDLDKVRRMTYTYVTVFGKHVVAVYPTPDAEENRYSKAYGAEKANFYDEEAFRLVESIYKETYTLMLSHKESVKALAEELLRNEILTHLDVVRLLGIRSERRSDRKPIKELFSG